MRQRLRTMTSSRKWRLATVARMASSWPVRAWAWAALTVFRELWHGPSPVSNQTNGKYFRTDRQVPSQSSINMMTREKKAF